MFFKNKIVALVQRTETILTAQSALFNLLSNSAQYYIQST